MAGGSSPTSSTAQWLTTTMMAHDVLVREAGGVRLAITGTADHIVQLSTLCIHPVETVYQSMNRRETAR